MTIFIHISPSVDATNDENNIENISSKSSLDVDSHGKILSIKEKIIFSNYICVGTYYFSNVKEYMKEFDRRG